MKETELGVRQRERERGDLSFSLFGVGGLELRGVSVCVWGGSGLHCCRA